MKNAFSNMSEEFKSDLISKVIKTYEGLRKQALERAGEPTQFDCPDTSCGGKLCVLKPVVTLEETAKLLAGNPKYSKKNRLKKKFAKQYDKKYRAMKIAACMMQLVQHPKGFVCGKCGMTQGYYQTMAQSMIKIESLPIGAKLIY